jgi:hypothetical protein
MQAWDRQSSWVPQNLDTAHGWQVPPQSTSLSPPFFWPSLQAGATATHTPPSHLPPAQSAPPPQRLPSAHGSQVPPQSTSLSAWFLNPSAQVAVAQKPSLQKPLRQFWWVTHPWPSGHWPQSPPPQSTPDSSPFLMPSVQVATSHWPPLQYPEAQSGSLPQAPPRHCGQPPPQSTPASPASCTPLWQAAAPHTKPGAHHWVAQSASPPQALPWAQPAQAPPQSTSVSSPSFWPLAHGSVTACSSPPTVSFLVWGLEPWVPPSPPPHATSHCPSRNTASTMRHAMPDPPNDSGIGRDCSVISGASQGAGRPQAR